MNNFKWQSVIGGWIFLLPLESHLLRTASGLNCPTVSLRRMWSITTSEQIQNRAGSKLTKPNSGETTWKIASLNTCRLLFWKMLKLSVILRDFEIKFMLNNGRNKFSFSWRLVVKFFNLKWRNIVTHGQLKENLYIHMHCNLMNKNVPLRCEFEFRSDEVYSIQHYVIKFVSVSIIDWNFTKNVLYWCYMYKQFFFFTNLSFIFLY